MVSQLNPFPRRCGIRSTDWRDSNKEDLRLIEEMGITPDISYRSRKHSLKTIGLAVMAAVRMQKLSEQWAGQKRVHAQLVQKVEAMRRRNVRPSATAR
jgi:hypothetical protein